MDIHSPVPRRARAIGLAVLALIATCWGLRAAYAQQFIDCSFQDRTYLGHCQDARCTVCAGKSRASCGQEGYTWYKGNWQTGNLYECVNPGGPYAYGYVANCGYYQIYQQPCVWVTQNGTSHCACPTQPAAGAYTGTTSFLATCASCTS